MTVIDVLTVRTGSYEKKSVVNPFLPKSASSFSYRDQYQSKLSHDSDLGKLTSL